MDLSSYKAKGKINNKHLLTLKDYNHSEIFEILYRAIKLKYLQKKNKKHNYLSGATLASIFETPSPCSRVSFEQAIKQLGGTSIYIGKDDLPSNFRDYSQDCAMVLNRYNIDGLALRTESQIGLESLAEFANMPVINASSNEFNPCQALADLLTIYEAFGKFEGIKLGVFGYGSNTAQSLMIAGAKVGLEICVCTPKGFTPKEEILAEAKKFGLVTVTDNIEQAIENCQIVYTDSYKGNDKDKKAAAVLTPYQVNAELLSKADKDSLFMHPLPCKRNEEVSSEVIDSPRSIIYEQAENRLHVQKAVMSLLMK